jgi:hypothetical protein
VDKLSQPTLNDVIIIWKVIVRFMVDFTVLQPHFLMILVLKGGVALEQEIGIEDPLGSRLVTAESLDLLKDPEYFSGQGSNCSGFGVRASGNLYHNFYYDSLSFQNLGRSTSFVGRHLVEEEYLIGVLRYISDTVFSRSVIHDFEGRDKNYISIRCIKDE